MSDTIEVRQTNDKTTIVYQLKLTPIVSIVCNKSGISRATYYRWRQEDMEFAKNTDEAIKEGVLHINDLAEGKLISRIQAEDMTAIIFWLKHHHNSYLPKPNIVLGTDKEQKNKKLVISWEDPEKIQQT